MSLTAPYARVFYVSDGITSVFSFPFVGINRDYIRVNVQLPNGAVQNNVNVSIPLKPNGELVGNIVFGADQVPPAGSKIMIQRITPATQDTNYTQSIQFDSSAVDFSFDKLTARMQEIMDRINNSMVGVHPFQEFAINLQQMTTANQNQYLQMDFANKLIKAGLFMELMNPSGRFRVSNNGADWTFLPKSNDVQEFRQRTLTNPLRYIFEYRIEDKWYSVGSNGEPVIMNHNDLDNRNAEDCHPQSAITGLVDLLKTLAVKATDFQTGITNQNKGITQTEYKVLDDKINTAALSGTNIGTYWFGLTGNQSGFVVPNPTSADQNYYDFTTSNFYTAKTDLSGWNLAGSNPPPTDVDVNIIISSKFWDITEQNNQQGGMAMWSHTNNKWGYVPRIISFEDANLTGIPTAPDLTDDSPDNQIVNKKTLLEHSGGAMPVGAIFTTPRTGTIAGAVEANGSPYNIADYSGEGSIGALLTAGSITYVSKTEFQTQVANTGACDSFGWNGAGETYYAWYIHEPDGTGYTTSTNPVVGDTVYYVSNNYTTTVAGYVTKVGSDETGSYIMWTDSATVHYRESTLDKTKEGDPTFLVPKLNPWHVGKSAPVVGNGMTLGLTDGTDNYGLQGTNVDSLSTGKGAYGTAVGTVTSAINAPNKNLGVTTDGTKSGMVADLSETTNLRVMVQLATGATDQALETCTSVLSDVSALNAHRVIEFQAPTAENGYTWYRKYADGWVEQGGDIGFTSNPQPISLPVEMTDANYTAIATPKHSSALGWAQIASKTATVLSVSMYYASGTNAIVGGERKVSWQVSGMAAA
nr:MAG TPA: tail fiber protein [Microviridae sp.]